MKTSVFNNLKVTHLGFVFLSLLVLNGCGQAPIASENDEGLQAVKVARVISSPDQTVRKFPAQVSAVKTVAVSFEVAGRLVEENLLTGSVVKKGDVIAKIDPTPFEQRVREAQARLNQANRDLSRTESTFEKGLASQAQLDNAKTTQELAKIALDKASQDLSYTTLVAPFDAQVSERLVENNSFVRDGETIARLQDVSRYYFNVNVPERVISRHREGSPVIATASIVSAPEKQFQLEYVEHATQPDPITQTYKVVFAADSSDENLTPGARATVNVSLGYTQFEGAMLVPFSSVQGNDADGFHVWKYNPNNAQVNMVNVNVVHIEDRFAVVKGDVQLDDLVVAAGASQMREGLLVKPYQPER